MDSHHELLGELESQKALLIAVSTGGPRIQEKNAEYITRHRRIREELEKLEIENPVLFGDLWEWYGKWSDGSLPTYQSRRAFISRLFQPLIDALQSAPDGPAAEKSKLSGSSGLKSSSVDSENVCLEGLPRVFISHASADAFVAMSLIKLLESALSLASSEIRCTSIDGYRLKVGAGTNERLRLEVNYCPVFIALLTHHTLKSQYMMFEMGARWGAGAFFAPLLARGIEKGELKEPIAGINWLDLRVPAQVEQLIRDLAQELRIEPEQRTRYQTSMDELVSAAKGIISIQCPIVEVVSARWGIAGAEIDVTEAVRRLSEGDFIVVLASNQLSGGRDPIYGTRKRLKVEYRVDEKVRTISVPEGATAIIPEE